MTNLPKDYDAWRLQGPDERDCDCSAWNECQDCKFAREEADERAYWEAEAAQERKMLAGRGPALRLPHETGPVYVKDMTYDA